MLGVGAAYDVVLRRPLNQADKCGLDFRHPVDGARGSLSRTAGHTRAPGDSVLANSLLATVLVATGAAENVLLRRPADIDASLTTTDCRAEMAAEVSEAGARRGHRR